MVGGSLANYENLDSHQIGIYDYFRNVKYGFGRATDIASNHIRRGRLSLDDGMARIKRHDGKIPWSYLGKSLADLLGEF